MVEWVNGQRPVTQSVASRKASDDSASGKSAIRPRSSGTDGEADGFIQAGAIGRATIGIARMAVSAPRPITAGNNHMRPRASEPSTLWRKVTACFEARYKDFQPFHFGQSDRLVQALSTIVFGVHIEVAPVVEDTRPVGL
jgi:hypothetical protein